jgi:hypothetical protein
VPIKETLQLMLSNDYYRVKLRSTATFNTSRVADFCDGSQFRPKHPVHPSCLDLKIIAYYDGLEISSAVSLSSSKESRLCLFYYVIANLPPEWRSKLEAINI